MVRIEFVKGLGGIVNIVNGNLRDTDRNELTNIEDVDSVRINARNFSPIGFNNELKAMAIGGYIIVFDSLASMQPYLEQIDLFDGQIFNPGVDGVQKPDWDVASRDKTEGIQPHTYVDTDIEKELIG